MKKLLTIAMVVSAIVLAPVPGEASAVPLAPPGKAPLKSSALRSISGATPLPFSSEVGSEPWRYCGTGANERHWEADNSLAVNPANPDNLAAAWIQDWSDAIVVAYSYDGGETWAESVPPTTPCTGGIQKFGNAPGTVSTIDPSVSFGADGTLYLSTVITSGMFAPSALIVDRSLDGGKTWVPWDDDTNIIFQPSHIVDGGPIPEGVDYSYVVADPQRAGVAYVTWYGVNLATATTTQYLSVTTDGGENWSDPSIVPAVGSSFGARLLVRDDGAVVSIGGEHPPQPGVLPGQLLTGASVLTGPTTVVAKTLVNPTDPGAVWSPPVTIGIADAQRFVAPTATLAPDGNSVYVTWPTTNATKTGFSMMLAASGDGGASWRAPAPVGPPIAGLPATGNNDVPMAPSIAVTQDGMIGIAFYDHRADVPANDPPKRTDVWLRYSKDGGVTWQEEHVAGPFDKTTAPLGVLADMNGMVVTRKGFAAIFSLAQPLDGANYSLETQSTTLEDGSVVSVTNTDIFFTTMRAHGTKR